MLERIFCLFELKLFHLKIGKEFREYSLGYNALKDKVCRAEKKQTQE
jgi:hypothetical protein